MMKKIEVIGLGAGDIEQLPLGIYRKLTRTEGPVFVRTLNHPVIQTLEQEGIKFYSFDSYYESSDHFQTVYTKIVHTLLQEAKDQLIYYAVPGHPMLAEKTVQLLLDQTEIDIKVIGGQSFLDDLFTSLEIDPIDGFQLLDATSFDREEVNYRTHIVFCQVYDPFVASHVKLTLLEDLAPEHEVIIIEAVGTADEKLMKIPLAELDRVMKLSNLTSVYIPPSLPEQLTHQFSTLRSVIRTLRGPDGCPWDKKQTHETLRQYAIEEVYELIDAINLKDDEGIVEELGDVLLQVMLHSQIGEDFGYFTIDDVIKRITTKMIHRHPHVFKSDSGKKSWEELKQEEKKGQEKELLLNSVIRHAPALEVAYQLQKKAASVGFDWDHVEDVWDKLKEEIIEFREVEKIEDETEMEKEFGDILFTFANICRFYRIHPELALHRTNEKFVSRFNEVERQVRSHEKTFDEMTLKQFDHFWEEAKRKEE